MASLEQILVDCLGTSDRWQWRIFQVSTLCGFFIGLHALAAVFLAATPDHWCAPPTIHANWTTQQLKQRYIPLEEHRGGYSQCRRFVASNVSDEESLNVTQITESCEEWIYDQSEYSSTVTIQWNLVCQYEYLFSSIQATYMAGVFAGNFLFTTLADRFGRRPIILMTSIVFILSSVSVSFSPNYWTFIFFRFLSAMAATSNYQVIYILLTEISVSPKSRSLFGIVFAIPFAVGYLAFPVVAYFIRDWSLLQLIISVPSLALAVFFKFLPESPRWLITQGRFVETLKILKEGAKVNGVVLPADEELLLRMQSKEFKFQSRQKKTCFLGTLCQTRIMIRKVFIIFFTWFTVSMVYYGLALHVPKISQSKYLVFFLSGALEIPAYILCYFVINWIGRRLSYSISFILAGLSCLATIASPAGLPWLPVAFSVLGKFLVTFTFAVAYLYTAELFPTIVRSIALGYSSMFARIGSMMAPYIVDLLANYHSSIPPTVFGVLSIAAGILSYLLPETSNMQLSEITDNNADITDEQQSIVQHNT